jgi:hypothetical protein
MECGSLLPHSKRFAKSVRFWWYQRDAPVQEDHRIRGLILGAGGDIVPSQDGQKPFQFMITGQMQWETFEEVAMSSEPSAIIAFCRECKVLASNNFRKPPHGFVHILWDIVILKQPVVY